jgi:hypothetical protein
LVDWRGVPQPSGLYDVASSILFRPVGRDPGWLLAIRKWRFRRLIRDAARSGKIAHIWWHPHNFGVRTKDNLALLTDVIRTYQQCASEFGMRSLTMKEAALLAGAAGNADVTSEGRSNSASSSLG